jgi:hypothetical protein
VLRQTREELRIDRDHVVVAGELRDIPVARVGGGGVTAF